MRKILFYFDVDPDTRFEGYAVGTTWNGFDNVCVTPAVAAEIDAHFKKLEDGDGYPPDSLDRSEPIVDMPIGKDGLIDLSCGFATVIAA